MITKMTESKGPKEHHPLYSMEIGDSKLGVIGYLCIDRFVRNIAHGGIRIKKDLSFDELRYMSRTMSYKSAFIGLELGGAKSGIIIRDPRKRTQYLEAFGRAIAPLMNAGLYIPGTDMGCSNSDIQIIMRAAGRDYDIKKSKGQSHIYTGWGIGVATEEALKLHEIDVQGATVAIEGLGRVGRSVALWLHEKGAKIVAASTLSGAIYNPQGLDIPKICKLAETHGDSFVLKYKDSSRIKLAELLELKVDVLIPCASIFSIREDNYARVKARIVCPGANHPMNDDIARKLHERGIFVFPDYVSNCCGILGSWLEKELSKDELFLLIDGTYRAKMQELLAKCGKNGYLRDITDKVVLARLEQKVKPRKITSIGFAAARKILPGFVKSKIFSIRLVGRFERISFCRP